jgi:hypothetical protein
MAVYRLEILKPLFEKSLKGEISRQDVLAEITPKKMISWKPAVSSQDTEKFIPRRGFVRVLDE